MVLQASQLTAAVIFSSGVVGLQMMLKWRYCSPRTIRYPLRIVVGLAWRGSYLNLPIANCNMRWGRRIGSAAWSSMHLTRRVHVSTSIYT